jgi:hypothetical protein
MIETTTFETDHTRCFRLKGVQSVAELDALSSTLLTAPSQRCWRVLFDWTQLEGWDDRRSFNLACQSWGRGAGLILRVSIIHRSRWNNEAALLAAVLRTRGVEVRSWPVNEHALAIAWLSR